LHRVFSNSTRRRPALPSPFDPLAGFVLQKFCAGFKAAGLPSLPKLPTSLAGRHRSLSNLQARSGFQKIQALSFAGFLAMLLVGCRTVPPVGATLPRSGQEIVVAGQFFPIGTPVVLWMDPGGYDAYRVERRFVPLDQADWENSKTKLDTPNRFNLRRQGLSAAELEQVRGGGWDLPLLQKVVDQFVIHFDVCGTSRQCFKVLHDLRGLSVHFMLDLDGTIYQTLDLKERAWHATTSNSRSIGIEIAHIGAYPAGKKNPFAQWYQPDSDSDGSLRITVPPALGESGIRTPAFVGRPARPDLIRGNIQGQELEQYDFTPEQYRALIRLTAALCKVFPQMKCDYPRSADGLLIPHKLPDEQLANFKGVLGHFHVQTNKVDPGPAFQWDKVISGARAILNATSETYSHGRMRWK
jgi:N-acetylmuramoyl-L-alanine amidase